MKIISGICLGFILLFGGVGFIAQSQDISSQPVQIQIPPPTPYAITTQDGNSRVWQQTVYAQSPTGGVATNTHSYTELATGLNHLVNGQWVESSEQIDILPNGTAAATNGQHQAYFPGDIYQGQIELVTPDGLQLQSRPIGLCYDDGTNTVMIAVLTNSVGQVLGTNQVIYTNAFIGLTADVLYSYRKAGFEQDIVLRQQPPTPESLGLNPDTARLQVLTEFFNPPEPAIQAKTLPPQAGVTLPDQRLGFGTMQMIRGRAFLLGKNARNTGALVGKQWVQVNGRNILIEEVPVNAIASGLAALPLTAMNSAPSKALRMASRHLKLPSQRMAKNTAKAVMVASADLKSQPGMVLDYVVYGVSELDDLVFQGDTTYYVSDYLTVGGVNCIIEGGSVIKFASGAALDIYAQLACNTSPYRPAILTAVDDDSVGETISGSTGNPSGTYADFAIGMDGGALTPIQNLRISYANLALGCNTDVHDCQFVNDSAAINQSSPVKVNNVLLANIGTAFEGYGGGTMNVTFATAHNVTTLLSGGALNITNSLLIGVANLGGATVGSFNYNYTNSSDAGIFQTIGAGAHYLAVGCPSAITNAAGTTNIDQAFLADIRTKTTYPPIAIGYSNVVISTNITLSPQAPHDTITNLNLGYHYDPIDYLVDYCVITNASLLLTNGVAVATCNDYGFLVKGASSIVSIGSPLYPDWFVRYSSVQEQAVSMLGHAGSSPASGYDVNPYLTTTAPSGQYRFTKFACPAGGGFHLYHATSPNYFASLLVRDSEFWSGTNVFGGNTNTVTALNNDLFVRSPATVSVTSTMTNNSLSVSNTLFWNLLVTVKPLVNSNMWYFFNNDFDSCNVSASGALTVNGYNGYYNATRLKPNSAADVVLGAGLVYQTGPLGTFYQPTDSGLIDKGSTNANLLGLYHYTTQTNEVKETNSIVDIGYHYMATDGNGVPLDSNTNGIPDYFEDANGNGLVDNGESNWGLAILTQPASQSVVQTSNATFSVTAAGIPPLAYQWYFNSSPVASATNATLTINNVQTNNAGTYYVVVTNSLGLLTSSNAVLTVLLLPTISITNPVNNAVIAASLTNLVLSASAADQAGTITQVQFFQGSTSLGIVTNSPYNLTWSNAPTGYYGLTAVVADDGGHTATSSVVNITITPLFATNTLALWLKADAITGLANNASVGTWYDSSGWGNNAQNSSHQPTYITNAVNGLPVVWFNATNSQYLSLTHFLGGMTGAEAFVVLKVTTATPSDQRGLWQFGNGTYGGLPGPLGYPKTDGTIGDTFCVNTTGLSTRVYNLGVPEQPLTQYHIYQASSQSNSWSAWINGVLQFVTNNNAFTTTTSPLIGRSDWGNGQGFNGSAYLDGDLAEMIVFNRALASGERDAINGYLNLKYGLVTNSPVAPTNLSAMAVSTSQISLTWSFNLGTSSTLFQIGRSATSNGTFSVVATVRDATSYLDTNLTAATTYYYRVTAANAAGTSVPSNLAWATTLSNGADMPLNSLSLWLKADTGMILQGANQSVPIWLDQSGNTNDAFQGTASQQPRYITNAFNGRPTVHFTATNSQYLNLPNFMNAVTGAEAFVVLKVTTATPSDQRGLWQFGYGTFGGLPGPVGYPRTDGTIGDAFCANVTAYNIGVPVQPLTQYHVYQVSAQGFNWSAWINGVLQKMTNGNVFATNPSLLLGRFNWGNGQGFNGSAYFDGDIAEMMVFNRALTVSERDSVGGYLFSKYGLLASTTNAAPITAPTNFIATGVLPNQLNLRWLPTSSNSYSYHVERKLGTGGVYQEIAAVPSYTTNYVDTTACPTNTYFYRIKAHNFFGDAYSAVISPPTVSMTNWPVVILLNSTNLLGAQAADADGTVSNVAFYANNQLVGITTSAPYTNYWIPAVNRTQPLAALATDNQGNSQFSAAVTVYLDSNQDGIPDYLQVMQGNDPINPWIPPAPDTNGPPAITLLIPTNAVIVP
jgi:hypothetical protein